ncbi:hypothetical protein BN948_01797 [Hydrogenophaga intermedia]|uniref:Uncharacterized protein n=1 Tax=Hydrogenophaga intermedia TaxID=65786 RepID=A0A1L1PPW9_HYDIT|nr:hypothetical protein [Hydrogenophaga intermedia]CDN87375.1 hypothetical protein BN948_01797 [Hydrogenophaga intermedia]
MSQPELTTREVYARHTGVAGGSYVQAHLVWDADKFFAARARDAENMNSHQAKGDPRLAKCEQITHDQYLTERKART